MLAHKKNNSKLGKQKKKEIQKKLIKIYLAFQQFPKPTPGYKKN
jgi:hypothetical protein